MNTSSNLKALRVGASIAFLSLFVSGCGLTSTSPDEAFSSIIKEETSNFVSGEFLLKCIITEISSGGVNNPECERDTENMIFASQRIVKKFGELEASQELEPLVNKTLRVLSPLASTTYDDILSVLGDNLLEEQWDILDLWQPYF